MDRSWLYDDDEECFTQSSFTAFQSPSRQAPGTITEITIDFRNWAEKFAILLLPLGELVEDDPTMKKDAWHYLHLYHIL